MARSRRQIRREVDAYLKSAALPAAEQLETPAEPRAVEKLRTQIQALIDEWAPVVGVRVENWRLQPMDDYYASTDWARGTMKFCTRLARKSPSFVEFVVVHELVHLLRGPHGHDQRFYDLMDRFLPSWRRYKLRKKKR